MFNKQAKKGFTLIELLVVVLIIGILAAVALPQYNLAVARTQVTNMLPLVQSLASAQERYYLENDRYSSHSSDLDIQIPSEVCQHFPYPSYDNAGSGEMLKCGKDFMIHTLTNDSAVLLQYCPGGGQNWTTCNSARVLRVTYHLNHNGQPNTRFCDIYKNTKLAVSICAGLPGFPTRYM